MAELFPTDPLGADVADLVSRFGYRAVHYELEMHRPLNPAPSAPARFTDPPTSHAAGPRSVDVSRFSGRSRQAKLLRLLSIIDLTDQEAAVKLMGEGAHTSRLEGCRRRMSDLRAAGYLGDTGRVRCNPGSNDESTIWTLTLAGKRALERLDETGWSR